MSDSRLRELERKWRESGSTEDGAAWLKERVRVGDLENDRLELAAYCGHEAARLALGENAPEAPEDLEEWATSLVNLGGGFSGILGLEVLGRVALEALEGTGVHSAGLAALESLARYVGCPCVGCAEKATDLADKVIFAEQSYGETNPQIQNQAMIVFQAAAAPRWQETLPRKTPELLFAAAQRARQIPGIPDPVVLIGQKVAEAAVA